MKVQTFGCDQMRGAFAVAWQRELSNSELGAIAGVGWRWRQYHNGQQGSIPSDWNQASADLTGYQVAPSPSPVQGWGSVWGYAGIPGPKTIDVQRPSIGGHQVIVLAVADIFVVDGQVQIGIGSDDGVDIYLDGTLRSTHNLVDGTSSTKTIATTNGIHRLALWSENTFSGALARYARPCAAGGGSGWCDGTDSQNPYWLSVLSANFSLQ